MKRKKVIVIGAGLAGLSAAYELTHEPGIELHILEERSEVGGRVYSKKVNQQMVDFGGFIIHPWYKHFHELVEILKCKTQLKKIPSSDIYYDIEGNGKLEHQETFKMSFLEALKLFLKALPEDLLDYDPTSPHLHYFEDLSVKSYLEKLELGKEKETFYIKLFDAIAQGYCYGPVEEYKMAFVMAIIHQDILHEDLLEANLHSASYFPEGTHVFVQKLVDAIQSKGGVFHLNTKMERVSKNKVITNKGVFLADAIIFAQNQSKVKYTHFITATVEFEKTISIEGNKNWMACFYKSRPEFEMPILSGINLEGLYTKALSHCVNLNIKVPHPKAASLTKAQLLKIIRPQLEEQFPNNKALRIIEMVEWKRAIPIAQEKFVDKIKEMQGKENYYFAGDFLGCPCMETALVTGKRAAQALINKQK